MYVNYSCSSPVCGRPTEYTVCHECMSATHVRRQCAAGRRNIQYVMNVCQLLMFVASVRTADGRRRGVGAGERTTRRTGDTVDSVPSAESPSDTVSSRRRGGVSPSRAQHPYREARESVRSRQTGASIVISRTLLYYCTGTGMKSIMGAFVMIFGELLNICHVFEAHKTTQLHSLHS